MDRFVTRKEKTSESDGASSSSGKSSKWHKNKSAKAKETGQVSCGSSVPNTSVFEQNTSTHEKGTEPAVAEQSKKKMKGVFFNDGKRADHG